MINIFALSEKHVGARVLVRNAGEWLHCTMLTWEVNGANYEKMAAFIRVKLDSGTKMWVYAENVQWEMQIQETKQHQMNCHAAHICDRQEP